MCNIYRHTRVSITAQNMIARTHTHTREYAIGFKHTHTHRSAHTRREFNCYRCNGSCPEASGGLPIAPSLTRQIMLRTVVVVVVVSVVVGAQCD